MRVPPGSQLVFNQVLSATSPSAGLWAAISSSEPKFNDWLGRPNDLRLFVVVDRISQDINFGFSVYVDDTADEETLWVSTRAVYSLLVPAGSTAIFMGSDTDASRGRPGLGIRRITVVAQSEASTAFSARVRVWATGHNGYRRYHRLLLAERIDPSAIVHAPHDACAWIAGVDKVAVSAFAEEVAGATATLGILADESPNGRVWNNLLTQGFTLTPGGPYTLSIASISDPNPPSGFLRFGLEMDGTSGPAATVRLWVTGRDVRSG